MSFYDALVISVAVAWTLLSILNQFEQLDFPFVRFLRALDIFNLLPLWTFFAPNPGQSDYHLIYRDRYQNDNISEWAQIALSESRRWYSFFWNPHKRSKKVLSDIASSLIASLPAYNDSLEGLMFTTPYLILLNVVSHQPPVNPLGLTGRVERQFLLLETFGFEPQSEPRCLLRSKFHPLIVSELTLGS
jgi:hypothetical protein